MPAETALHRNNFQSVSQAIVGSRPPPEQEQSNACASTPTAHRLQICRSSVSREISVSSGRVSGARRHRRALTMTRARPRSRHTTPCRSCSTRQTLRGLEPTRLHMPDRMVLKLETLLRDGAARQGTLPWEFMQRPSNGRLVAAKPHRDSSAVRRARAAVATMGDAGAADLGGVPQRALCLGAGARIHRIRPRGPAAKPGAGCAAIGRGLSVKPLASRRPSAPSA